jgi:hypothetical protein
MATNQYGKVTDPRPCPFCWALDDDIAVSEIQPGVWAVVCNVCGAQGPSNHLAEDDADPDPNASAADAVEEWSRRA